MTRFIVLLLLFLSVPPARAMAQSDMPTDTRPGTVIAEGTASYNTFDSGHGHVALGGGVRIHAARRVSLGVEFQRQMGNAPSPYFLPTATATLDLRGAGLGTPGYVQPFLTVTAGFIGHSNEFGSSAWPALAVGGGLRVWLSRGLFLTTSVRAGSPQHARVAGGVGVVLR